MGIRVYASNACNFGETFCFILGYSQLTMLLIVSGGQQRNSAIHICLSILPQTPIPPRLPHNIEQSSLCYTIGPCLLSILNTALNPAFLRHSFEASGEALYPPLYFGRSCLLRNQRNIEQEHKEQKTESTDLEQLCNTRLALISQVM